MNKDGNLAVDEISHSVEANMHECLWNKYIVNPMSVETIKDKISNKEYSSLESFLADLKWIQHNSYIYKDILKNFITKFSRLYETCEKTCDELVKKAEEACQEIEKCPDCVLNATQFNFPFIQPCDELHPIVFARRQGSAIWPGKAIAVSKSGDTVR